MSRNDENILKRFIKRKLTFTTSLMVGFLITGGIVLAGEQDDYGKLYTDKKTTIETSLNVDVQNKISGVEIANTNTRLEVNTNSGEIVVKNTDNQENTTSVNGVNVYNGGSLLLGKEGTEKVTIETNTTNGIATGVHLYNGKGTKTQSIDINANNVEISANSKNGNAFGIAIASGNMRSNNSTITINSKNTKISTNSNSEGDSIGIQVRDKGTVNINNGNLEITSKKGNSQGIAIITGGNSTVNINAKNNSENNTVKLNGDIVFQKYEQITPPQGWNNVEIDNDINSKVTINLANKDSVFNGKIGLQYADENTPDTERVVKDLKLTIANGATWNVQGNDGESANYIFGDIIVKNGGVVNHSGTSFVYNNDGNDKGLQLQGGAILNGTGIIQTGRDLAQEGNTKATNVITVSNAGNIINSSGLTLVGNIKMNDNSVLRNKGSLITSGTILVGNGATFTNEKGATLKGSSNNILIDAKGGIVKNNGTIDLAGTTGSIAMNGDKDSILTNAGLVIVDYKGDKATQSKVFGDNGTRTNTNTGKVQINGYDKDKNGKRDKLELENLLLGENAKIENSGMFVDENGVAIVFEDDSFIFGDTTEKEVMENLNGKNSIDISKNGATIKADSSKIEGTTDNGLKSLNVNGELTLAKGDNATDIIEIENLTTNISNIKDSKESQKIIIGEGATANFINGTINGIENKTAIELSNNGTLGLKDMVVKGDIVKGGNATTTTVNMSGNNSINGKVDVSNVNISSGESTFGANSSFGNTNITVADGGKLMLDVTDDGTNAFLTTDKNGGKVTLNGNFGVTTEKLTEDQKIELGKNNDLNNANFDRNNNKTQDVYITNLNKKDNVIEVTYNKELLSNYGDKLNNINNGFQVINDKISQNAKDRVVLADKVYAGTIYAETVRMAYDNSKLVENELVKINPEVPTGEWVANGKALFMKNKYDRDGILSSYNSEKESTGLLAVGEYGLDETTNVGLAFAGIKHKLDTDTGKADGDAFYFGTFAKKQLGDYRLNAGLGYELNRFDVDEKIFGGSEKYDANVYSAYVEGRYVKALGDDLRVEPKLKLGYTYVDQDSVKDGTYDMGSQDISVFDTEFGADFIKTVALKDGKLNGIFSLSYTLAFGDTDDEFTGRFYNSKTVGSSFNMMGAEIAERSLNLGAGLEVTKDTGLFYNGGVTFKAGSDSYRDYGFTLGAGYRF